MYSQEIMRRIRSLIAAGKIRVLKHAADRMALRGYTLPEIEQVLKGGLHETERDEYDQTHSLWTYTIRGSTRDGRKTRVVLVIVDELLVVTVVGPLT
ncbi:MAG: DUF4258 domain-containing protein [Proteobacteria bacterium]|nr:DUF4258 domain-containing protein [Pseudomonadota bacterium]